MYQCYATHKKFVLNGELYIMQYTVVNLDGPVALSLGWKLASDNEASLGKVRENIS